LRFLFISVAFVCPVSTLDSKQQTRQMFTVVAGQGALLKAMARGNASRFAAQISEDRVKLAVERNPASFIAGCAYRPSLVELVLALHDLILRGGYVGRKSEQEILRDALLNTNPG
jgi:hypothetical protein